MTLSESEIICGIHRDLSSEDYHRLPFASAHRLMDLDEKCPAAARYKMLHPDPPTAAMLLGTAVHDLVLEGKDTVAVAGQCAASVQNAHGRCQNAGKHLKAGRWLCGTHMKTDGEEFGKTVLSEEDYVKFQQIALSVNAHPEARRLLDGRTHTELSIVWTDRWEQDGIPMGSGVKCKMRADGVIARGRGICFDLKTTASDASPKAFQREIWDRKYYRQGALYLEGLNRSGIACESFCLIVVEKVPPYLVCVYEISDEILAIGREENAASLKVWKSCVDTGIWPGYSPEIQTIGIPSWALKQL